VNYREMNLIEDLPIGIEIMNVRHYSVHRHGGILEIAFVLKGTLDLNVSFDHLTLKAGDFAFMNHHDFHSMDGKDEENVVAFLYLDLKYYSRYFANIEYITFISEDETNDRKNTKGALVLKNLMIGMINELSSKQNDYKYRLSHLSFKLIETLVNEFNEVVFYNQKIKPNSVKIDRYYLIMRYILENAKGKDILEEISNNEYFCKSYLYHLFKDVVTFSFQDIVCLIRNSKSEELLLNTRMSISEISAECGYSDPKYYYRHFKKWYHCTPAEFRQKYQDEISREDRFEQLPIDQAAPIAVSFLNPSVGEQKFDQWTPSGIEKSFGGHDGSSEYGIIRLDRESLLSDVSQAEVSADDWADFTGKIESIHNAGLKLCISTEYTDRSGEELKQILNHCIAAYGKKQVANWEFWIYYGDLGMTEEIRTAAADLKKLLPAMEIKTIAG